MMKPRFSNDHSHYFQFASGPLKLMSTEKYERPASFPAWVDSAEDDALVVEAEALGASERVFTSKANCEKFVTTKRSLSGKY
jgi:hypothetical protein